MTMKVRTAISLVVLTWCVMTCGCQQTQTELSIPGDMKIKRGDPARVTVTVGEGSAPNRIVIQGPAPKKIDIKTRNAGSNEWSHSETMAAADGQYFCVFPTVRSDLEYMLHVDGSVVRSEGRGFGPYTILVEPEQDSPYANGHELGLQYRNKELRAYRLVIELYPLASADRDEFLQGFEAAYVDANDVELGQKYAEILRLSLSGAVYEQALEQGRKHVAGQITHAQVQNMIRASLGQSRGYELAWKAGYIEGFVQGMLDKRARDKESLYSQAEAMYNSLSRIVG